MEKINLNEYLAANEYPGRGIAVAKARCPVAVHRLVFLVGLMRGATNDRISENLYRTKKTVCCDQ